MNEELIIQPVLDSCTNLPSTTLLVEASLSPELETELPQETLWK